MLDVCVLGTSGMMPLPNRYTASLLLRYKGELILIDCGEGTQVPFKLANWGFKGLTTIFLTHYHADHTAGLPGLLLTLGNSDKKEPINIYGPDGIHNLIQGVRILAPELPYQVNAKELPINRSISLIADDIKISTLPVNHKKNCLSYSIEIVRKPKFIPEKAKELNIPVKFWKELQQGTTLTIDGNTISPEMVVGEQRKGLKISYCVDTRPTKEMPEFFKDSDLLICEGIYPEDEKLQKAIDKKHMIFSEAAQLAVESNVKELWLTHFSPAVSNPKSHEENVRKIFENTHVSHDLKNKTFIFED